MKFKTLFEKNIKIVFLVIALFVTFGLSLSMDFISEAQLGIKNNTNELIKFLIKFKNSFSKNIFESLIIFAFTSLMLWINNKECYKSKDSEYREKNKIFKAILALLFSLFTVIGYSYAKTNSWSLIFNGKFQFLKVIIIATSYFIIYKLIIDYVFDKILIKINYKPSNNKMFNFIFEKHSFIMPLVIILLGWVPYIIFYYPGILVPDSSNQIKQFFGMDISKRSSTNSVNLIDENVKITNHHPVLHTFILGNCLKIGKLIGSDNFGIFIYTAIQVLIFVVTLAYIINYMKTLKTNNYIRAISLLIFSLLPIFPVSALQITKDIIYTSALIIYIGELYKIIKDYNNKKITLKNITIIIFLSLMVCLFRNNGLYVILLSLPFTAIANKTNRKQIVVATLIVFIVYQSFIKILLPALKIPNTGVREMLSVPFQQTARYIKEYEQDVTEEEKNIIDNVLNYSTLAERYDPQRSDDVKRKYNKDATSSDLKDYFKVWFKQFLKHPTVYIESFINNYYGYFYLEAKPIEFTASGLTNPEKKLNDTGNFNYFYNPKFKNQRANVKEMIEINRDAPIISWYTNLGLNTWIVLGILAYLLYKKHYKFIVYLMPSLVTILVCCVSPVNTYFRYLLPNIFGLPLIISIFLDIIEERKKEEV